MIKNKSNSFLALSFSQGFVSPNIPIITLSQGDTELNFILDTGSDRNIIDVSILPKLEYEKYEKLGEEITQALTGAQQTVREEAAAAAAGPKMIKCPYCGAQTEIGAGSKCEYCGGYVGDAV